MKKPVFVAFFLLIVFSLSAESKIKSETERNAGTEASVQQNYVISGLVADFSTNETLAGAVITVDNQKLYSDLDGNFVIKNSKGGKIKVTVSMISYVDQVVEIKPGEVNTLKVKLKHM